MTARQLFRERIASKKRRWREAKALNRFRDTCGYVLMLSVPGDEFKFVDLKPSAFDVFWQLQIDPRRPLNHHLWQTIRKRKPNRPMTWRTFCKAVETLREIGLVEGDRVARVIVDEWNKAWEEAFREPRGGLP